MPWHSQLTDPLVFPGSMVNVQPEEVRALLAPGERLQWACTSRDEEVAVIVREPRRGDRWTLFFYGNAMTLADTAPVRDELARDCDGVVCVDYVGFGLSPSRPSERGCYRAADAAVTAAVEAGADPSALSVAGWSLGSAVAVDLAARRGARRLVLLSPLSSLAAAGLSAWTGGALKSFDRGPFSAVRRAAEVQAPTLLVVGSDDQLTPVSMANTVRRSLRAGARLEIIPGTGHNDLLAEPATWAIVRQFLAAPAGEGGQPR